MSWDWKASASRIDFQSWNAISSSTAEAAPVTPAPRAISWSGGILNAVSGLEPCGSCIENVNLYPWLAHILGLAPPKTDGSLNVLAGTLRDGGDDAAK